MSIFWAVRVERRSSLEQKWRGMSLPVNPECGNNVVQVVPRDSRQDVLLAELILIGQRHQKYGLVVATDVLGTVGSFHNKTLVAGNIWQWGILFRRACGARPGAMWRMRGLRPTDVGGIQRVQSEALALNPRRLRDAALVAFGLCRDSPTCSHQGAGRPFAENPSARLLLSLSHRSSCAFLDMAVRLHCHRGPGTPDSLGAASPRCHRLQSLVS
eukprot:s2433_g4.t3